MNRKFLLQSKLLEVEFPIERNKWIDYQKVLGLKKSDNDVLFELLLEYDLNSVEVYEFSKKIMPIHIWRSISQLKVFEDFKRLLNILIDPKNVEASWFQIDFPNITVNYGIKTLYPITEVFDNININDFYKLCLIKSIQKFYNIDKNSNDLIKGIIRSFFTNNNNEFDTDFVNYILNVLVEFKTYEFTDLLIELDEGEIINLNLVEPRILDQLIQT